MRRITVTIERQDAHPGDLAGRSTRTELAGSLLLSDLVSQVVEPFLMTALRTRWVCRCLNDGHPVDIAEVTTSASPAPKGRRLLVADTGLDAFLGSGHDELRLFCRTVLA